MDVDKTKDYKISVCEPIFNFRNAIKKECFNK